MQDLYKGSRVEVDYLGKGADGQRLYDVLYVPGFNLTKEEALKHMKKASDELREAMKALREIQG